MLSNQRETTNLFCKNLKRLYFPSLEAIDIDIITATLGGKIIVPTLDYKVNKIAEKELPIPPGTQPGTEFRIKNRGVSSLRGRGKGDQYVVVAVNIPKDITPEQKELLLKYKELNKS